jgi:hypothetical protein
MKHRRKIIWLLLCGSCLLLLPLKPDGGIIFIFPLMLLTFPAGLVGEAAFGWLYEAADTSLGWDTFSTLMASITYFGATWLLVVGAGYTQWFVVLPWVARKWDRLAERSRLG